MTGLEMTLQEDSAEKELLNLDHLGVEILTGSRKEIPTDFREGIKNNHLNRGCIPQPVLPATSNVKSHLGLEKANQYTAAPVLEGKGIMDLDAPYLQIVGSNR